MEKNEEKQLVKYKFGGTDIDLNKYIGNIKHNVDSYLQYLKNHNGWNDLEISEFKNAYNLYIQGLEELYTNGKERFSTNEFGDITDLNGLLSDQDDINSQSYYDNKGNTISSEDYAKLKDRKKENYHTFLANRLVAEYFRKIGKKLKPITEEETKKKDKFNLTDHGFIAYWSKKNNPGGGPIDLKPWLEADAYDEQTGKRVVNLRALDLAADLLEYKQLLKDYDFEESPFGTKDAYITSLDNLYQKLTDGTWDYNDFKALNQAGIGGNFTKGYFSEEKDPNITPEEKKKLEEEAKKLEEEAKKKEIEEAKYKMVQDRYDNYLRNNYSYTEDNPLNIGLMQDSGYFTSDGVFDGSAFGSAIPAGTTLTDYMNKYLLDPWSNQELARTAWAGLIGYHIAQPIQEGKLLGWYYVPLTSDDSTNSVLVYNPTTGAVGKTFIGNTPVWKKITDKWNIDNGIVDKYKQYASFKLGGTIPEMQLGGNVNLDALFELDRQKRLTESGKNNTWNTAYLNGRTAEQQEAGNRIAGLPGNTSDPTLENPNNGFSKTDILRLGTIAADIVSMGAAFAPGVGTAVSAATGIGSTLGTLFADVFEDGPDAGDAKNFVTNLGMDFLGLIPGGGAASKGLKIAKTLGRYASRIIAIIGAGHTIANGNKIIDSYSKLMSDPSNLTVDDWRNISAGLGLVTGGSAAITRKYQKAKTEALLGKKVKDNIAVEMIDPKGQKKMVMFAGEEAKTIKEANKAKDFKKLQDATINKYERFKGWSLAENKSIGIQTPLKHWKLLLPFTYKPTKGNIYDVKADTKGVYVDKGKWQGDVYLLGTDKQFLNVLGNGKKALLQSEVDQQIKDFDEKSLFDSASKASQRISNTYTANLKKLKTLLEQIKKLELLLNGRSSKVMKANRRKEKAEINKTISELKKKLQREEDLNNINYGPKRGLNPEEYKEYLDLRNQHEQNILSLEAERSKLKTPDSEELKKVIQLEKSLRSLKKNKLNLEHWVKDLKNGKIHSREYLKLLTNPYYVRGVGNDAKFIFLPSKFREPIEKSMSELLKKYNIIYKKGGSLNINKVRSFGGGGITNTSSTADWYLDMFNSPEMQKWLETFNKDNYQNFNDLQNSWSSNLKETGYKQGITPLLYNLNVYNRQGLWNTTNTNPVISRLRLKGIITTKGNSGDNSESNYLDGYFGELEFLRHGGTKDSWIGREKELKDFQTKLASKGLSYILNNKTGMYELGLINNSEENPNKTSSINHALNDNDTLFSEDSKNSNTEKFSFRNLLNDNPTLKYAFPRVAYLNRKNDKMSNLAEASERTFLQDPLEKTRRVEGSYKDLIEGQYNKAQLNNMASLANTSDANTNNALRLEAYSKGLDYELAGKLKDDEAFKNSEELALLLSFENLLNRHDVAMQNRLALLLTLKNKSQINLAKLAKNTDNTNTLLSQIEQEARLKNLENQSYKDAFTKLDIHNAITYNLKNYVEDLTDEELSAWNDVVTGKVTPSEILLDPKRKRAYILASLKALQAENDQFRIYKGIPNSKWSNIRRLSSTSSDDSWYVPMDKNGSKLEIAKIKAKIKDSELFLKSIRHNSKLMDKQLDRISKSLYGYIKSIIVK